MGQNKGKAMSTWLCFSSAVCKYSGMWRMVAPAFAMASDVPPMAKLPHSTGSAGSAGGMGFTSTNTFFPTTHRVVAKYFLGS